MSRFALTLFVFLAIFAIGFTEGCGPDEIYKMCGTACQPKCGDLTPYCIEKCKPGCFCRPGLVRDDNNRCISARDCPQSEE